MSKTRFPITVIILCLIAFSLAVVVAAGKMGVFDPQALLGKLPIIGDNIKKEAEQKIPTVSPIEQENQLLRLKIKELEGMIVELEKEKTSALKQTEDYQKELLELRAYKDKNEELHINAAEMAKYYSEMKPQEVVEIMKNLDDETVMTILPILQTEQVGKILAAMEPQRAAFLTQMLLGNDPSG